MDYTSKRETHLLSTVGQHKKKQRTLVGCVPQTVLLFIVMTRRGRNEQQGWLLTNRQKLPRKWGYLKPNTGPPSSLTKPGRRKCLHERKGRPMAGA